MTFVNESRKQICAQSKKLVATIGPITSLPCTEKLGISKGYHESHMAAGKLGLDPETLQIAKRILSMPPKPHKEMKLGKRKAKAGTSPKPKNVSPPKAG